MARQRAKDILLIVLLVCIPILLFFIWDYLYQLIDFGSIGKHIDSVLDNALKGLCLDRGNMCLIIHTLLLFIIHSFGLIILLFLPIISYVLTIGIISLYFDNLRNARLGDTETLIFLIMGALFVASVVFLINKVYG